MFKNKYETFAELLKKYNIIYYSQWGHPHAQTPEELVKSMNIHFDLDYVLGSDIIDNAHLSEVSAVDSEAGLVMRICFANEKCADNELVGKVLFYTISINKDLIHGDLCTYNIQLKTVVTLDGDEIAKINMSGGIFDKKFRGD